jgi:hypothetical protein
MARAIKTIRAGQSRGQLDQAFTDKLAIAGTMAGIGAAGHLYEGARSEALQEKQKQDINRSNWGKAFANQTAQRDAELAANNKEDAVTRASAEQYGSPERDNGVKPNYAPAWLEAENAKQAQAQQTLNDSAELSSIGGHSTAEGRKNDQEQAGMIHNDIVRSKDGIGMAQSLPRQGNQDIRGDIMGRPNEYPAPAVPPYVNDPEYRNNGR